MDTAGLKKSTLELALNRNPMKSMGYASSRQHAKRPAPTMRRTFPINRYSANAVFHGHCHHGALRGETDKGAPVYNVAMPLLKQHTPEQRFVLVEI